MSDIVPSETAIAENKTPFADESAQEKAKNPSKPVMMLWLLAFLGIATSLFSGWGLWRVADLSMQYQNKDDRTLMIAVNLKEEIASFSKLTYDFLLQQDFNRMLMKEKQSNKTRDDITQGLGNLAMLSSSGSAGTMIEAVRYNVMQFLVLTDKALETAVEDGAATKARAILQDEVEPALRAAQNSLNAIINSRQKLEDEHFQFVRQQSIMLMLLLVGLTALGMAVILSLHAHVARILPANKMAEAVAPVAQETLQPSAEVQAEERKKILEARSLATLALINRLNRLHKDSEDLKKEIQGIERYAATPQKPQRADIADKSLEALQFQGEKIAMAVGRIQHVNDQTKHFVASIGDLMHDTQNLATEGNVIALNVTIELAKLQAQMGASFPDEKNRKISDQIRTLATTAASITGRMAMVLSQFRYAQEDFARQAGEIVQIKDGGAAALEQVKSALQNQQAQNAHLLDERGAIVSQIPAFAKKIAEIEQQIAQIQAMAEEEIDDLADIPNGRQFKVISGGAA